MKRRRIKMENKKYYEIADCRERSEKEQNKTIWQTIVQNGAQLRTTYTHDFTVRTYALRDKVYELYQDSDTLIKDHFVEMTQEAYKNMRYGEESMELMQLMKEEKECAERIEKLQRELKGIKYAIKIQKEILKEME